MANQKQTVCIRREAGNCRICYHAAAADIGLTKDTNIAGAIVKVKFALKQWFCFLFLFVHNSRASFVVRMAQMESKLIMLEHMIA